MNIGDCFDMLVEKLTGFPDEYRGDGHTHFTRGGGESRLTQFFIKYKRVSFTSAVLLFLEKNRFELSVHYVNDPDVIRLNKELFEKSKFPGAVGHTKYIFTEGKLTEKKVRISGTHVPPKPLDWVNEYSAEIIEEDEEIVSVVLREMLKRASEATFQA